MRVLEPRSSDQDPDLPLLEATAAGDVVAFRNLFERYVDPLFRFALSRLGDRSLAEDAVQETLAAVWRGARSFAGRSKVSTWLYGICRHTIAKIVSRHRVAQVELAGGALETGFPAAGVFIGCDDEAGQIDRKVDIEQALRELSPQHREVVVLAMVNGLPLEEVAELTEVPLGTVKSRLHWARIYLARKLSDDVGRSGLRGREEGRWK